MKRIMGFSILLAATSAMAFGAGAAPSDKTPPSPRMHDFGTARSDDGSGEHGGPVPHGAPMRAPSHSPTNLPAPGPMPAPNGNPYAHAPFNPKGTPPDWHPRNDTPQNTWRGNKPGSGQPQFHWRPVITGPNRDISHFSPEDRTRWQGGRWHHGNHHGRSGWWWISGGTWFFYDAPIYPYPTYESDYYDFDDSYDDGYSNDYAPGPDSGGYYWYYCRNPEGYYPYVQTCRGPWQPVSPTPNAYDQGSSGGPDSYDDGDDGDQGPPPAQSGSPPRSNFSDQQSGDDGAYPPPQQQQP